MVSRRGIVRTVLKCLYPTRIEETTSSYERELVTIPNWADILQGVGSAVSAITSIALVVVALLFREEVRAARKRPLLRLDHDVTSDDAVLYNDPDTNYWLMLRVNNAPKRDLAVRVQLHIVQVVAVADTPPLKAPVPERPFLISDVDQTHIDLPANVTRRFMITYVYTTKSAGAELNVWPRSTTGRDVLPPGSYRLILSLTADNADATYWVVDLRLTESPLNNSDPSGILTLSVPISLDAREALLVSMNKIQGQY